MADSNAELRDRLLERPIRPLDFPASGNSKVIAGKACLLCGYSFRESTGSAAATVELLNSTQSGGGRVAEVALASGGFDTEIIGGEGILCEGGLFLGNITGSVVGSIWVRL